MLQKICPICDGKLKGNYCPFCRKIVRRPLVWEVGYYLNERRPEGEEYPGSAKQEVKSLAGADLSSKAEKARRQPRADQERKKREAQDKKKAEALTRKVEKKRSHKLLPLAVAAIVLIAAEGIGLLANYLSESVSASEAEKAELAEYTSFEIESLPEDLSEWLQEEGDSGEYTEETDGSNYQTIYLDEADVISRGTPCMGLSHFPVTYETAKPEIDAILSGQGWTVMESEENSSNMVIRDEASGEEYTYYNKLFWWDCLAGDGQEAVHSGAMAIDSDTASGEIHSLGGWFYDDEAAAEVVSQIADFLEREMDLPEDERCAKAVREAVRENAGNEDGYTEFYPGYILWVVNDDMVSVMLEAY